MNFSSGLNRKIKIVRAGYFAKTPQRTLIVNGTNLFGKDRKTPSRYITSEESAKEFVALFKLFLAIYHKELLKEWSKI
ncbi:MAG: hypothetical protein ACLVKO_12895 [Dysgonomonas sp.]